MSRKPLGSSPSPPDTEAGRSPRVFTLDDVTHDDVPDDPAPPRPALRRGRVIEHRPPMATRAEAGWRWGTLLLTAATALAGLAFALWFSRFVTIALAREDWIGWTATALMSLIALSLVAILIREIIGLLRLRRLTRVRAAVDAALAKPSLDGERAAVRRVIAHYRGREDMSWGLARLKDHEKAVLEPGEYLRLADRELLMPLDRDARRIILRSSKRVATVTAMSPFVVIAMGFVAVEAVSMFRALATLYGGRPGVAGGLKLGRLVVGHILATGGLALTDDLFGQFLGQDVLRRVSRRLGEGAFNGALTARLGIAAVAIIRPLPPIDGEKLRVREIVSELFRSMRGATTTAEPPKS